MDKSQPKKEYQIIIVGGGGHGLATAYYLAKNYNITDIAVIEKGWIGGGNTGRNTTIIRSNYLQKAPLVFMKSLDVYMRRFHKISIIMLCLALEEY